MAYWLHRVEKHCNGLQILFEESRLTIGFSDWASDPAFWSAFERASNDESYCNGEFGKDFDRLYRNVHDGGSWRQRWSLWYFIHDMTAGDVIVVPYTGGFCVCKLKGRVIRSERRDADDIGWEWDVEIIAKECAPRGDYATTSLLSKMKCLQTTLCIQDIASDVELAVAKCKGNKPYCFEDDLAQKCHELIDQFGTPDEFELLVKRYFNRQGGQAEVLPKNYSDKMGDCDVSVVFPALRLRIYVQCKKHWGQTNEWAIQQISEFANAEESDDGWLYAKWVVSFADEFTDAAKAMAKKDGVILISGKEFCKMLVSAGVGQC